MKATIYNPSHLKPWTMPRDYFGEVWPEYYSAGVIQTRDSDALERSNFRSMLRAIGGEQPDDMVRVVRENHWACGWIEWIAIHQDCADALRAADEVARKLENYPIIDEEDFSELEDADCEALWSSCYSQENRIEYLRDRATIEGNFRHLSAAVRGSWHDAAQVLPCPSGILY